MSPPPASTAERSLRDRLPSRRGDRRPDDSAFAGDARLQLGKPYIQVKACAKQLPAAKFAVAVNLATKPRSPSAERARCPRDRDALSYRWPVPTCKTP